jgi:hypothetical protein
MAKRRTEPPPYPPEVLNLRREALNAYYNSVAAGEKKPAGVAVQMKDGKVFIASSRSYQSSAPGVTDTIETELKNQFVIAYGTDGADSDFIAAKRDHIVEVTSGRRSGEARTPLVKIDGVIEGKSFGDSYDPS